MMAVEKCLDDCYFYFYSSCTKGEDCPYRHCKEALGTEIVCMLWKDGSCFRPNCRFRHMESRIKRASIPCYWENQPGGCRKPHCVFLHHKTKFGATDNQSLILPVSTTAVSSPPATEAPLTPPQEIDLSLTSNIHSPVQPLVVSFDEGEESDTESVSSTPVKNDGKLIPNKDNSICDQRTPTKDLGIKTLEQIKMEKIHKESEHFYKSAYDAPSIDTLSKTTDVEHFTKECYPPKSEFISLSNDNELDSTFSSTKVENLVKESDLRDKLLKKRPHPFPLDIAPVKRAINFKKQESNAQDSLNFKIKTLAEIRKERENKFGSSEDTTKETQEILDSSYHSSGVQTSNRKIKIIRRSADSYATPSIDIKECSEIGDKETRSQSVLHEVQNISETQIEPEIVDLTDTVCIANNKRKAENDVETSVCKFLRTPNWNSTGTTPKSESKTGIADLQSHLPTCPSSTELSSSPSVLKKENHTNSIKQKLDSVMDIKAPDPRMSETRLSSIDDFETFLNGTGGKIDEETPVEDDILQEIEQFLDS